MIEAYTSLSNKQRKGKKELDSIGVKLKERKRAQGGAAYKVIRVSSA